MSTRIVVCLNHFPLEVLEAGATVQQAKDRCEELDAAHKARKGVVPRLHYFCTVPEREPAPVAEAVEEDKA